MALKDKEGRVRISAAESLCTIQRLGPKDAVAIVIKFLDDKDVDARMGAVSYLANLGPKAKTAIPAITELLKDENSSVRDKAGDALEKIEADTQ